MTVTSSTLIAFLRQTTQSLFVGIRVEHNGLRDASVTPRPSALLVVVGERLGHGVMDYIAHIRLVDACKCSHTYKQ